MQETEGLSKTSSSSSSHSEEDHCWRGLETTQVTARLRKEHVQSVLKMAKMMPGGAKSAAMMAQFARQSSGNSGSTRAAYLRGKEDAEVAEKIHREMKRAQSLW